jgi:hypothetical protein
MKMRFLPRSMTYKLSSWSNRIDDGSDPHSPRAAIGTALAMMSW